MNTSMAFVRLLIISTFFATISISKELFSEATPPEMLSDAQAVDDGSLLTIKQFPRTKLISSREISSSVVGKDAVEERLDSIVLSLSRLNDRLVAMETKQSHQIERIDNINYKLVKIDVQGEERKSQLNDVATAVRHQLQRSEGHQNQIIEMMEDINTDINSLKENINTKLGNLKKLEGVSRSSDRKGNKLSTILTTVFRIRATTQQVKLALQNISTDVNYISNSTKLLGLKSENFVTRKDLVTGMADMKFEFQKSVVRLPMMMSSNLETNTGIASDCWELLHENNQTKSGVYRIQPPFAFLPFFVYCDMDTDGGGWTVFQKREDGSIDFAREWNDYKYGFGNLAGEFWIGNEKLYQLTNHRVNELKISLADFSQKYVTASYSAFAIGPESEAYSLKLLGQYKGDAGNSLSIHVGQKWSTYDVDNDAWPDQNCARDHSGAWWYRACETSNLNGRYLHGPVQADQEYQGIYWYDFHGPQYSLWQTTMMIRRWGIVPEVNTSSPVYT